MFNEIFLRKLCFHFAELCGSAERRLRNTDLWLVGRRLLVLAIKMCRSFRIGHHCGHWIRVWPSTVMHLQIYFWLSRWVVSISCFTIKRHNFPCVSLQRTISVERSFGEAGREIDCHLRNWNSHNRFHKNYLLVPIMRQKSLSISSS